MALTLDVEKLKDGLELPEAVARPALVVVSGLPGTGKSHFSRQLAQQFPSVVLESDALRRKLFHNPVHSAEESQRLFAACHVLIEGLLKDGLSVIFDATNLVEHHRERLYSIAQKLDARLILVSIKAPMTLVRQRLQDRINGLDSCDKSDAGWDVYQKMKRKAERIRHRHFVVDTSKDISPAIARIVKEFKHSTL